MAERDWIISLFIDSCQRGSEASCRYDTKPAAGGTSVHDVTTAGACQDPQKCVCGREETGSYHGSGL